MFDAYPNRNGLTFVIYSLQTGKHVRFKGFNKNKPVAYCLLRTVAMSRRETLFRGLGASCKWNGCLSYRLEYECNMIREESESIQKLCSRFHIVAV